MKNIVRTQDSEYRKGAYLVIIPIKLRKKITPFDGDFRFF